MANDLNIRIKINSDTKQLEITQDGFEKISGSAKKTSNDIQNFDSKLDKTINTVKDFAIAYISLNTAMAAGKYFVENADGLNRLDGRLKLATDSTAEFHSQQKELLAIAKETHNPLQNITDLYIKMDPALEKLGATTKTTNQITENFAKGLKLGGANTVQSSAAILQFAQAMGSGVLRGDEFNSMAEASPKLMEYLAKGLKVPQGELRNMAEAGELTAGRVSAALLTMTDEINRDFKQMPRVVGDAAVDFKTEASLMVQEIDKATGATAALADGIDSAAALISNKNGVLDEFTDTVMTAGIAVASIGIGLGVAKLAVAGYAATTGIATAGQLGFTAAIVAGTVATRIKTAAAVGLRLAMNAIPLVAIATGVALVASHFITAARDANLLTDALAKTNEELQNMSKNQLIAQRSTIERGVQEKLIELQDAGLEVRRAKQSGANKEELNALKAHYDDLAGEYKRLTDQRSSIDAAMNTSKKSPKTKEDEKDALKKELEERQKQIDELLKNGGKTDKSKKGKAGKTDEQKEAEERGKLNKQLEEELFKSTHTQYEIEVKNIEDTVSKYIDGGADRVKAKELEMALLIKLGQDELKAFTETEKEKEKLLQDIEDGKALRISEAYGQIEKTSANPKDEINNSNLSAWETIQSENERLASEGFAPLFDDTQMNEFFKKWQESIDGVKGGYNEISDAIGDYGATSKDWTAGLTGQAKSVANISNALADVFEDQNKYDKLREKINTSTLTDEEKKIEFAELENKHLDNQLGMYSNIAGAMSGLFKENSVATERMIQMQQILGIITAGVAVADAARGGDPYSAIPRALAMAALMAQFVQGFGGGSGSGYTTPQSVLDVQTKQEAYKSETEAITSRLDRSNELLEIIGKTGSAAQVDVLSKKIAYDRTLGDLSYTVAQDVVEAVKTEQWRKDAVAALVQGGSAATGVSIGSVGSKGAYLDTTALAGNIEASVKYINYLSENIDSINFDGIDRFDRADVTSWVDDILEAVSEFSTGLIDNINALKDASGEFQDTFDSLTGTSTYSMQRLQKAYAEVNNLVGDSTLPEYLARQIDNIEKLNLSQSDIQTLLIQDTSALIDQEKILTRISGELGVAFEGGAKDALDYMESINLVSKAMVASRENTISFLDSLRTDEELALGMASVAGVSLATNVDQLSELFWKLRNDMDGLTDADLELLNANKSLIEAQKESSVATSDLEAKQTSLNDYISSISQNISTLQSALGNIGTTIDKLRESAYGSTYTMAKYRESMALALSLRDSTDYSGFATAIKNAVDASAVLTSGNTGLEGNQLRWEQAVAANQLKDLEKNALSQVDYLKMIEENTRAQVTLLAEQIQDLGKSLDTSSALDRELITSILAKNPEVDTWVETGNGQYAWTSSSGAVATGAMNDSTKQIITDLTGASYTTADAVAFIQDRLAQNDLLGIYNEAVRRGISSTSLDAMMGWDAGTSLNWAIANNLPKFADGGIVKGGHGGIIGQIGEEDYDEWIIPLKNPNDPIGLGALIAELRSLQNENKQLRNDMNKVLEKIESNTQKSRSAA